MFKGVSLANDSITFRDKDAAAFRRLVDGQAPECYGRKVDLNKVNLDSIRPWTTDRLAQLTGIEDDVVVEYVMSMLEGAEGGIPDPRKMHVGLEGFLAEQTAEFMKGLWELLLESQDAVGGIAPSLVEAKKAELRAAAEKNRNMLGSVRPGSSDWCGSSRGRSDRDARLGGRGGRGGYGGRQDRNQFVDKGGNVTTRVSDAGWGARARRNDYPSDSRDDRDYHDRDDWYHPLRRDDSPEPSYRSRSGREYDDRSSRHYRDDRYSSQPSRRYDDRGQYRSSRSSRRQHSPRPSPPPRERSPRRGYSAEEEPHPSDRKHSDRFHPPDSRHSSDRQNSRRERLPPRSPTPDYRDRYSRSLTPVYEHR